MDIHDKRFFIMQIGRSEVWQKRVSNMDEGRINAIYRQLVIQGNIKEQS